MAPWLRLKKLKLRAAGSEGRERYLRSRQIRRQFSAIFYAIGGYVALQSPRLPKIRQPS
jgi:hypothetical protein